MSTARQADRPTRQPGRPPGSPAPTDRPTATYPSDCPTEVLPAVPVRRPILRAAARRERSGSPFAGWRDQTPTEQLPATPAPTEPRRDRDRDRVAARRTLARHLRAALTGLLIAAAILTGLQLYAAQGISQARQAALAQRDAAFQVEQVEQVEAPSPQWTVEGTTTAVPSPLDLPRCTTSPDTPLPCLATVSPDSRRAVVLEEDASLTALARR